jgi:hypothetical protein
MKKKKTASGSSRGGPGDASFNDAAHHSKTAQPAQASFWDACREQTRLRNTHVSVASRIEAALADKGVVP